MDSISQKYEEEKMAIIIMELIGVNHNNIYYPTIRFLTSPKPIFIFLFIPKP